MQGALGRHRSHAEHAKTAMCVVSLDISITPEARLPLWEVLRKHGVSATGGGVRQHPRSDSRAGRHDHLVRLLAAPPATAGL